MGCASSHSVGKIEQQLVNMQQTIDYMKLQIESQSTVVHDSQAMQQELTRQSLFQAGEHVSLCADFQMFISIARENEATSLRLVERVQSLESKIANNVKVELNKMQEQLHNLESSTLSDGDPNHSPIVLAPAYRRKNVQKSTSEMESQLTFDVAAGISLDNLSGDSAEGSVSMETGFQSDSGASEAALENVFVRSSLNLNKSSSSIQDHHDVAAILEPEDSFEAEISSIAARVHRHPHSPVYHEPKRKGLSYAAARSASNEDAQGENITSHVESTTNIQAISKIRGRSIRNGNCSDASQL
jgi:hypothetical protein